MIYNQRCIKRWRLTSKKIVWTSSCFYRAVQKWQILNACEQWTSLDILYCSCILNEMYLQFQIKWNSLIYWSVSPFFGPFYLLFSSRSFPSHFLNGLICWSRRGGAPYLANPVMLCWVGFRAEPKFKCRIRTFSRKVPFPPTVEYKTF